MGKIEKANIFIYVVFGWINYCYIQLKKKLINSLTLANQFIDYLLISCNCSIYLINWGVNLIGKSAKLYPVLLPHHRSIQTVHLRYWLNDSSLAIIGPQQDEWSWSVDESADGAAALPLIWLLVVEWVSGSKQTWGLTERMWPYSANLSPLTHRCSQFTAVGGSDNSSSNRTPIFCLRAQRWVKREDVTREDCDRFPLKLKHCVTACWDILSMAGIHPHNII